MSRVAVPVFHEKSNYSDPVDQTTVKPATPRCCPLMNPVHIDSALVRENAIECGALSLCQLAVVGVSDLLELDGVEVRVSKGAE